MKIYRTLGLIVVALLSTVIRAQNPQNSLPVLNVNSMDKSIDPCVDFFAYSCGGWIRKNPIPPDQSSWSVYGKLQDDHQAQLRGHPGQCCCCDRRALHLCPEDRVLLRILHGRERCR